MLGRRDRFARGVDAMVEQQSLLEPLQSAHRQRERCLDRCGIARIRRAAAQEQMNPHVLAEGAADRYVVRGDRQPDSGAASTPLRTNWRAALRKETASGKAPPPQHR